MRYIAISIALALAASVLAAQASSPSHDPRDDSQPLILSDYLPQNPQLARSLSQVKLAQYPYPSYSGLFTVDNNTQSNMFFWFFPAENQPQNAPVVMWLQGGPGASSLYGLFTENGPFSVAPDGHTLLPRPYRWTQNFSMLYLDNPVGVGFSFTQSAAGYVTNEDQVGTNIVAFLTQFFQVFSDFANNKFYIAGESYGGKYTPSAAYAVHQWNVQNPSQAINLAGMSLGDGLVDPQIQMQGYAQQAYVLNLADNAEYLQIRNYEARIQAAIARGDAEEGFRIFDEFMNGDFYPYPTYFYNITGDSNYFNLNDPVYPPNPYSAFLKAPLTRAAIHVGALPYFSYNSTVEFHLIKDWLASVKDKVEFLLSKGLKVLVYNGQYDIILAGPQALQLCLAFKWPGQAQFKAAKKILWRVDPKDATPAGYVHTAKNLYQVIVRAAGHMVPADQPRAALDMMTRFINGVPFTK